MRSSIQKFQTIVCCAWPLIGVVVDLSRRWLRENTPHTLVEARSEKPLRICDGCLHAQEPEPQSEPEPELVAEAVRTFATSHFKALYQGAAVPGVFELGYFLTDLIRGYCAKENIPWKEEGQPYLQKLQTEAMANAQELVDQIPVAAQRIWTSALTLRGREFCYILNQTLRDDVDDLMEPAAALARAINRLCASAGALTAVPVHPPKYVCYRG